MAIKQYIENNQKFFEVYVNGHDSRGKRVQWRKRGVETLKKAQTMEFEFKRKLAVLKEQKVDPKFGEWYEECFNILKLTYRPSTYLNYRCAIDKWVLKPWKELYLRDLGRAEIHILLYEGAGQAMSDNMRKYVLKVIKRMFQVAVDHEKLDRNPAQGMTVKVPEPDKKVLTANEARIFLNEARATNHRFYPIWVMALFTGMRSGELYALQWANVDLENKIIHVGRSWSSKNGYTSTKNQKSRVVPISEELLHFLKEWKLGNSSRPDDFVLPHLVEWTRGTGAELTRMFCKSIGITEIKFHDLRATFITNLLVGGESLARVMAIVGHSDIDTTNIYLRLAGVDLKGATDRLGYELPTNQTAQVVHLPKFGRVDK